MNKKWKVHDIAIPTNVWFSVFKGKALVMLAKLFILFDINIK